MFKIKYRVSYSRLSGLYYVQWKWWATSWRWKDVESTFRGTVCYKTKEEAFRYINPPKDVRIVID